MIALKVSGARSLANLLPNCAIWHVLRHLASDCVSCEWAFIKLEQSRVIEVDNLELAVKDVI